MHWELRWRMHNLAQFLSHPTTPGLLSIVTLAGYGNCSPLASEQTFIGHVEVVVDGVVEELIGHAVAGP